MKYVLVQGFVGFSDAYAFVVGPFKTRAEAMSYNQPGVLSTDPDDYYVAAVFTPDISEKNEGPLALPKPGSVKQDFLLHFARAGEDTRARANVALGCDEQGPTNRITDLIAEGWLEDTGEHTESNCGVKASLVRVTERGRRELRLTTTKWFPNGERVC